MPFMLVQTGNVLNRLDWNLVPGASAKIVEISSKYKVLRN